MNGKAHLSIGVLTGMSCIYLKDKMNIDLDTLECILVMTGCSIGSLLPDIDLPNSMLGRFVPFVSYFAEHRTWTHSLFFVLVLGLIAFICKAPYSLIFGLCLGIGTHLILDSLTPMGLPYLFYPFIYDKNVKKKYQRRS